MGDPAGYLDEGKGLPWITMVCLSHLDVRGTRGCGNYRTGFDRARSRALVLNCGWKCFALRSQLLDAEDEARHARHVHRKAEHGDGH